MLKYKNKNKRKFLNLKRAYGTKSARYGFEIFWLYAGE